MLRYYWVDLSYTGAKGKPNDENTDTYDEDDDGLEFYDPSLGAFVQMLLSKIPELEPIYEDHVDNTHSLMAYGFFVDICPWVEESITQECDPRDRAAALRLIEILEAEYPIQTEGVQELVSLSFLENLQGSDWLVPLLGPNLLAEYRMYVPED